MAGHTHRRTDGGHRLTGPCYAVTPKVEFRGLWQSVCGPAVPGRLCGASSLAAIYGAAQVVNEAGSGGACREPGADLSGFTCDTGQPSAG